MTKWYMKDFEVKSYRLGSQLKNGLEWAYKIVWNGKTVKDGFSRKYDAVNFVRKLVKIHNLAIVRAQKEDK